MVVLYFYYIVKISTILSRSVVMRITKTQILQFPNILMVVFGGEVKGKEVWPSMVTHPSAHTQK